MQHKNKNNMRKLLSFIIAASTCVTTFAQMPQEGYTGFGFNVTGLATVAIKNYNSSLLSNQTVPDPLNIIGYPVTVSDLLPQNLLFVKHYFSDDMAGRLSIGINSNSTKYEITDSTGFNLGTATTTNKLSSFSFGLGVGIEKHASTNSQKADPYMGVDLNFALVTGFKNEQTYDESDTTGSFSSNYTVDYPGGMGVGLNLFGGFNYFFAENIALGAEAGIGFNFLSMGGDWTSTYTTDSNPGNSSTTSSKGTYKNTSSGVAVNATGGVNLTIFW